MLNLLKYTLDENSDCFMPESLRMIGSENYSAERVRRFRKKQEALHCNTDVIGGNEEKELELEKESEGEKEGRANYQLIADMYNDICVSFPRLTKLSDTRRKAVRARLRQYSVSVIGLCVPLLTGHMPSLMRCI